MCNKYILTSTIIKKKIKENNEDKEDNVVKTVNSIETEKGEYENEIILPINNNAFSEIKVISPNEIEFNPILGVLITPKSR